MKSGGFALERNFMSLFTRGEDCVQYSLLVSLVGDYNRHLREFRIKATSRENRLA